MRRSAMPQVSIAVVLACAGFATSAHAQSSVDACVGKTGAVRIVASTTACAKNETRMTWGGSPSSSATAFKAYTTGTVPEDDQVFPNSQYAVVRFETTGFDDGGNYDPGTSTYTVPSAGVYHFDLNLSVLPGQTQIYVFIAVNDELINGNQTTDATYGTFVPLTVSADFKVNAGDKVQVLAFALGDGAQLLWAGGPLNTFSGHKVY